MKQIIVGLAILASVVPAAGQSGGFASLFAGKDVPFSLKLKELNSDWRRLSITTSDSKGGMGDMMSQLMQAGAMSGMNKDKGKDDAASAMLGMSLLGGLFGGGGSKEPVYYSKGQTVTVGTESFLVAYRYPKPESNFLQMAMEADKAGGKEPDLSKMAAQGKMTPDSALTLSLINVRSLNALNDIRPFDMNAEIAESAKAGGGGLLDLIAQQSTKEKDGAKPEGAAAEGGSGDLAALQVELALGDDPALSKAKSSIKVKAEGKSVVLTGTVATAQLKQRATNLASKAVKDAGGGYTVKNQLVVK